MSGAFQGAMETTGACVLEMWISGAWCSDDAVPGMWNGSRCRRDGQEAATEQDENVACIERRPVG